MRKLTSGRALIACCRLSFVVRSIACAAAAWLVAAVPASAQQPFRFVEVVQLTPRSVMAQVAGAAGQLVTKTNPTEYRMTLANVAAGGTSDTQQLVTLVDATDLSLKSSVVRDIVRGVNMREMRRKFDTSILDNKKTDVFEYRELVDKTETRTEPFVEYKVVDFVSAMLVAGSAVHNSETNPINLSMLRGRSVARVILRIEGPEAISSVAGTRVRVAPPDNPTGGIVYIIARTAAGLYYPALIRAATDQGLVELEGVPQ